MIRDPWFDPLPCAIKNTFELKESRRNPSTVFFPSLPLKGTQGTGCARVGGGHSCRGLSRHVTVVIMVSSDKYSLKREPEHIRYTVQMVILWYVS